ncbi:MAG: ATP-binding cassette domain-containing protein [Anaerolineales bacterium]|nr:ATP-binding cassette domain-containing protein [Anaerolineales bacterium]
MIRVEGLTKRYGERTAISGLTFHAEKGEIVGFLGPNGAGKTTTMRILTGYMPPSEGKASVAGFDLLTQSLEVRKRVGYLPENVPLYPEMTVVGYLDFMAELRQIPKRNDRVDEVMEVVHISQRAESFIGNLSKGLRQRVGLAQALLHKPEVLILDEPMEGLDPQQQIEVKRLIREVGQAQTVMLSTHILAHAQELCDRVIIINGGQIVAEDAPDRLSAQIAGGGRVHLQVDGDGAGLLEELRQLPGLSRVEAARDGLFDIETAPGPDPRPLIASTVVGGGWKLLELRRERLSLEEIFIQLTRDEEAAAEVVPAEAAGQDAA